MSALKNGKDTGIASPPLGGLDDDDAVMTTQPTSALLAGLKKKEGGTPPAALDSNARAALRQTAEHSPLVTTRSHRPPITTESQIKPVAEKVLRDGFSMPKDDHETLGRLAETCMRAGFNIGKSGVLRLGVRLLAEMDSERLAELAAALPPVPTSKRKR